MSGWNGARIAALKGWLAEGLSFSDMAAHFAARGFAVTRNAVIGKARRLGLSGDAQHARMAAKRNANPAPRPRRAKALSPRPVPPAKPAPAKPASAKPAMPPSPPPEPAPVSAPATPAPVRAPGKSAPRSSPVAAHPRLLWLIPPGGCHFPVAGEGAQTLFCADPAREGRPYCAHHHHIAHAPVTAPVRGFHDPSTVRARRSDAQGDVVDEMEAAA